MSMATKLGRAVIYDEGLPLKRSHDSSVAWSYKVR